MPLGSAQMSLVIRRIVLCLLIATIASLIASICTKAISTHFYRSTHFKKLHEALGKEFQLKVPVCPRLPARSLLPFIA